MGMRHVLFDMVLDFSKTRDRHLSEQILLFNHYVLCARNVYYLQEHPDTPKLYDAGIIYKLPEQIDRRPSDGEIRDLKRFLSDKMHMTRGQIEHHINLARGVEIFRDIPRIIENGGGDCDNLAGWRIAELVAAGLDARPLMPSRQVGGRTIYHMKVWHKYDNTDEDPSLIEGMGGADRAPDRLEECKKNVDRYRNYWRQAEEMLAAEEPFASPAAREYRRAELKAGIDKLGLVPRDGVFRVGKASGPARDFTAALSSAPEIVSGDMARLSYQDDELHELEELLGMDADEFYRLAHQTSELLLPSRSVW